MNVKRWRRTGTMQTTPGDNRKIFLFFYQYKKIGMKYLHENDRC